jgi:hypothetical protein
VLLREEAIFAPLPGPPPDEGSRRGVHQPATWLAR